MSKIVSMSAGAVDPTTRTKRVFWRPVTALTVIKIGQPVCYNSDIVGDHKERTSPPHANSLGGGGGTAYAEGSQTYTGRLFIVEEPLTANLHAFAGIVKSTGSKAGADGDMIEIFIPVEGVVVPVISDQDCVLDRTIVGIRDGEAATSYPGRPIGVAEETKDRSTTDGMVWMKFKNFEYGAINAAGDATANALIVDDEAVGNAVTINALNVRFDGTGRARMLYYVGDINGAGHSAYGMFKFRTYIGAALSQNAHTLCAQLCIKDAGRLVNVPEYASAPLYITVETEITSANPDLSGGSLAALYIGYYVEEGGGAPVDAYPFHFNTDQSKGQWDGLFMAQNLNDIGGVAQAASGQTQSWNTDDITIPIRLGEITYYLYASIAAQAA